MFLLVTLAVLAPAYAQDCSVKELRKELAEASPVQVAATYVKLARCDARAGRESAREALARTLAGEEGNEAVVAALRVGAADEVRTWMGGLEPDHRSRTIAHLGKLCTDEPAVVEFFVGAHGKLGDAFWQERWHRGLAECRVAPVQKILTESVRAREPGAVTQAADRQRFFSVLEIYARNLGGDALPTLAELGSTLKDEEELLYVVNAFADAAAVGSVSGVDRATAARAIGELQKLGPVLPPKAVDQARTTLVALGAEEEADQFAANRWRDRRSGGKYVYAVTVLEDAACKKGRQAAFHTAVFTEPGRMWPEQVEALLEDKLVYEWQLSLAKKCKGKGRVEVTMPREPFPNVDAAKAWISDRKEAFEKKQGEYQKVRITDHDRFEM